MDILKLLHDYSPPNPFPFPSPFNSPLAFFTLVLFVWSLGPALKKEVRFGFLVWLRLTWAAFLIPAVTGVILAVGGLKVPSATDAGHGLTKYGYHVDPVRDGEHLMYAVFALLSLYIIEVLVKGRMVSHQRGLGYLPVVTLFLYGAAYMVGRVAVFPGNH